MVEQELTKTVSRASFWYLDDGRVWTMDLASNDKRQALEEVLAAAREMETVSEFPATIGSHCGYCPYLKGCEFRGEVAVRREAEGW
jgi:hypothetical protein